MKLYECPACESSVLMEAPWTEDSHDSYEICERCGIQFGYHDADYIDRPVDDPIRHAFYRGWGAKWRAEEVRKGRAQLR